MAQHSKGKHAAKKAPVRHKARRAASRPAQVPSESGLTSAESPGASKPKHGRDAAHASAAPKTVDMPKAADAPAKPVDAASGEAPKDQAVPEEGPNQSAEQPKKKRRKKLTAKQLGIAAAVVVGLVGASYLGGVLFFSTHFFPHTSISTLDISYDSPEQAAKELDDKIGAYSFKVKGQRMNVTVTSDQAGMALDSEGVSQEILSEQDAWAWPAEALKPHEVTEAVAEAMDASTLSEVITHAVDQVNATADPPVNAAVVFQEDTGKFVIAPEVQGNTLDANSVVAAALAGVVNLEKDVILTKEVLVDPTVYQDDQRLADACAKANQLARADVTFTLDGTPAANINALTIGQWVNVTPEFEVLFNNDELTMWAEGIADSFDTVGTERTYVRPDGKEVTVKGGSYGWRVDGEALETAAVEAVQNGTIGTVEVPVLQSGHGFTALGAQDWGARYVDIDLSEQYARFYDDDGTLIWESDIVSGAKGKTDSPRGVYSINRKQSPTVLIGEMTSEGEPEYESKVTYWMPFKGNSVGLHDASWQSAFGGQRYASGYGSHGCINLPTGAAGDLYGLIEVGDVVVVHY